MCITEEYTWYDGVDSNRIDIVYGYRAPTAVWWHSSISVSSTPSLEGISAAKCRSMFCVTVRQYLAMWGVPPLKSVILTHLPGWVCHQASNVRNLTHKSMTLTQLPGWVATCGRLKLRWVHRPFYTLLWRTGVGNWGPTLVIQPPIREEHPQHVPN